MRKKHQPGCPCCPGEECECSVTQIKITLSSNNLYQMLCGAVPIGGPCPYIDFEFDIDDIYYLSISETEPSELTVNYYNTNGVQECETGRYCAVLVFNYLSPPKDYCRAMNDLYYNFTLYLFWDPTKTKTTCPTLENFEPDWALNFVGTTPDPHPGLIQYCEAIEEKHYEFSGGSFKCPGTPLEIDMELIIS